MARAWSFDPARPDLKKRALSAVETMLNQFIIWTNLVSLMKQAHQHTEVDIWLKMACYPIPMWSAVDSGLISQKNLTLE